MHFHHTQRHRDDRDRRGEEGAGLVEYALLLALIAFVCISALTFFGQSSKNSVGHSKDCILAASNQQALPANCGNP